MNSISVIGLGKLGACILACYASKGFEVTGVDVDPETVRMVNEARAPVFEPGLDALMAENRQRIRATVDYEEAIQGTDATFIVVPTPSEDHGGSP